MSDITVINSYKEFIDFFNSEQDTFDVIKYVSAEQNKTMYFEGKRSKIIIDDIIQDHMIYEYFNKKENIVAFDGLILNLDKVDTEYCEFEIESDSFDINFQYKIFRKLISSSIIEKMMKYPNLKELYLRACKKELAQLERRKNFVYDNYGYTMTDEDKLMLEVMD